MKYKVIAGGYRRHITSDHNEALEEAKRLSYVYQRAIVRPVTNNNRTIKNASDEIVTGNSIAYA